MNRPSISEKKILLFSLISCTILFLCLSLFSEGTYDTGDGIRHLVSRYSWYHHDLFLYSWGKPFFTLVTSPFSQFGLIGMNFFNILCGVGSAYFAYKIAVLLKLNYALLAIPFLLFTPCYFPTLNSGLTEPLFGLILIASVYLVFTERFVWASIIVSFLPFVRTEGNMILPLFLIVFMYRRKFLLAPLLGFGTFVYSVVGYFYFNDFFWVKNQNPYNGKNIDIYGSGDLYHFVNNHNFIWGSALGLLFIAGLLAIVLFGFKTIRHKRITESKLPEELILIYGSFIIYFVAHSIMWWKGLANSLGLIRVLAGVVPCSALICLRGFDMLLIPYIKRKTIIVVAIISILLFWVIRSPFKHEYFPYTLDQEQALIKEAGEWFKTSPYKKQKVYYLYPVLAHVLNVDSFDPEKVGELWGLYPSIKEWGIDVIPDSTIVFWDAHFGPNECKIPLDSIMNDPNFEFIKAFKPAIDYISLGGYRFEVYVFMKLHKPKELKELSKEIYDLEEKKDLRNTSPLVTDKAFSGRTSCILNAENEYSVTFNKLTDSLPQNCSALEFSARILNEKHDSLEAMIVFSVDDKAGNNLHWENRPINLQQISDSTGWKKTSVRFLLAGDLLNSQNTVSIYFWNKAKETFYVDDLEVGYWGK